MGKFLNALKQLNPRTGRLITSRGTTVNEADLVERVGAGFNTFDQLKTVEYTPIIERSPRPGFSVLRDRTVPAGETIDLVNGELVVDGSLQKVGLYTRKRGRYLSGLIGLPGLRVRLGTPNTGRYEYGYGDEFGNRFGLEWDQGELYTFVESAGDRYYRKHRSEWLDPLDGTGPSGVDADLNGLTLRLPFGWYGGLSIEFTVAVPDRENGDSLVTIDRSNAGNLAEGVTIEEPNLPIFAEADGGVIYIGGRQYGVYGRYRPEFRTTATRNVEKTGVGEEFEPIVSLRVKDAIAFRGVPVIVGGAGVLSTENIEWALFVDAELTGANFGPVPDVPATETALEQDSDATAFTGGYRVYSDNAVGGQGNRSGEDGADFPDFNIPSDGKITLAARALSGTTTVNGVLRVLEES